MNLSWLRIESNLTLVLFAIAFIGGVAAGWFARGKVE